MKKFWSEPIGHRTRSQIASGYYPERNRPIRNQGNNSYTSNQCSRISTASTSSSDEDEVRVLEDVTVDASRADDSDSDEHDSNSADFDSSEEEDEVVGVPDSNIIDYNDTDVDEGEDGDNDEGWEDDEEEDDDNDDGPVIVIDDDSEIDSDHEGVNAEEETGEGLQNVIIEDSEEDEPVGEKRKEREEEERDVASSSSGLKRRCLEDRDFVTIDIDDDDEDSSNQETKKRKFDSSQGENCLAKRTRSKTGVDKLGDTTTVAGEVNGDAPGHNGDVGEMKGDKLSTSAAAEVNIDAPDCNGDVDKMKVKTNSNKMSAKRTHYKARGDEIPTAAAEVNIDDAPDYNGGIGKLKVETGSEKVVRGLRKNTKRKCDQADALLKLFSSTIWSGTENVENQESVFPKTNVVILKKFNYGVEKEKIVDKSDNDKLIDALWDAFDLALASSTIDPPAPPADSEEFDKPSELDSFYGCCQGKHDFVLDEEVGIKCRLCSFVQLEIRYVPPTIDTSGSRRPFKKNYADEEESRWKALPFDDCGGDSQDFLVHGKGTVWDIFRIRDSMYPHQQEGFEFLWTNVAGGIDASHLKKSLHDDDIGGCVISHAPGTGKTYLTIAFLRMYMEVFKDCRPIIIAPCSMLLTWEEEFKKWEIDFPFHNLNSRKFSDEEQHRVSKMTEVNIQGDTDKRMVKLILWNEKRSMLGVSYPLFEMLTGKRLVKGKDNEIQGGKLAGGLRRNELEKVAWIRQILLERPSLLVLDEGHTPRNKNSKIWKALVKVKTRKRVILSGTPFQNNFEELYDNLCLVKPKFADRGFWDSLTNSVGLHDDKEKCDKIRALLDPFVHVHRGGMLKETLPGLRRRVVVLNLLPFQSDVLKGCQKIQNYLDFEYAASLVSVHPSLLTKNNSFPEEKSTTDKIASNDFRLDPNQGVKTRFLITFIKLCEALKEKILVFSQYIKPLVLIKDQLAHCLQWTEGDEVLYIHGKVPARQRQSDINLFNNPRSKAKVLLATTKTCREGINLIGASRVVLLDVVWNPSVERQAIGRAYRVGQEKVVYTYHLISGSMEEDKYHRQVKKDMLSELVFSSTQDHGDRQQDSRTIQEDRVLEEMVENVNLGEMFKEIYVPYERD